MVDGVIDIPLPGSVLDSRLGPSRGPGATLQEFVAGPENGLVETVIRSVLEDGTARYNPLVLFGISGTGKTHLARGLAAAWKHRRHRRGVVYITAVDFTRELADAIETQATDDFRDRYRKAPLLVFEDLGRLAGKETAQEELIHTFDALLKRGKQIVVTASAAPAQLPGMIPRLQSRLAAGLTVPLLPPGPDTRLTILQRLAGLRQIGLSGGALRILAEGLHGTVPELNGALVRLQASSRLDGGPIGRSSIEADAARRYLAQRNDLRQPNLREIAAATARFFSLKLSDLRSATRRRAVVTARGVAMYLARQLTGKSLDQIGDYFGGRDHTTVMHGCRRTEDLLNTDPVIREAVERFLEKWHQVRE